MIKREYKIRIFDGREIERCLISSKQALLFKRYFPVSFSAWENHEPTRLMSEYEPLKCVVCGEDLLKDTNRGIILFVRNFETNEICNVVGVCRGRCDRAYEAYLRSRGFVTGWEGIDDFVLPTIYLKKIMALINGLYYNDPLQKWAKQGIESYKVILLRLHNLFCVDNQLKSGREF